MKSKRAPKRSHKWKNERQNKYDIDFDNMPAKKHQNIH